MFFMQWKKSKLKPQHLILFFVCVTHIRKYYDRKGIDLGILTNLHVFRLPEKKKPFWEAIRLCALLALETGGHYPYSVFKSLSITGWCSLCTNILASKIRALPLGLQKQIWTFAKTALTILLKFQ
jgi:hypothetical protein